ncbi:hypothetical protein ACIP93_02585 [Streptomyces sp. NPDC088745]|uniref:hypothetical protein n=1 Tax=Streptomyces sp. NPDC088745 TaxID=3365884 RepID=UPI0038019AF2
MSAVGAGAAPGGGVPYRHVLHQHRAALRTALALAALAAALVAGGRLWAADGGWGPTVGQALALGLPLFGGMQVAGPMVAGELASGTYKLAWTQGVTPARWLAAKAAVPAGVLVALTAGLGWVHDSAVALGPAPVAYALFAVAFGVLCGLLVRRTTGAMALAGATLGVLLLAGRAQPHDTFAGQLTLAVPLVAATAVAAGAAFLLLRRLSRGDVS